MSVKSKIREANFIVALNDAGIEIKPASNSQNSKDITSKGIVIR